LNLAIIVPFFHIVRPEWADRQDRIRVARQPNAWILRSMYLYRLLFQMVGFGLSGPVKRGGATPHRLRRPVAAAGRICYTAIDIYTFGGAWGTRLRGRLPAVDPGT
jgi:hypothetical protein